MWTYGQPKVGGSRSRAAATTERDDSRVPGGASERARLGRETGDRSWECRRVIYQGLNCPILRTHVLSWAVVWTQSAYGAQRRSHGRRAGVALVNSAVLPAGTLIRYTYWKLRTRRGPVPASKSIGRRGSVPAT